MERLASSLNGLALQPPLRRTTAATMNLASLAQHVREQAAARSADDVHCNDNDAVELDELCTECCSFKAMTGFDVCGYCKRKSEHKKQRTVRRLRLSVVNHIKKADREARYTRHAARNLKKLSELFAAKMRDRDAACHEFGALFPLGDGGNGGGANGNDNGNAD